MDNITSQLGDINNFSTIWKLNTIVIITSIIDPPKIPLTYACRSVFTREQRLEQTKTTISSVRKYIPNSLVVLAECSEFTSEEGEYFRQACDLVVNIYELDKNLIPNLHSPYKALCESTMTIYVLNYIRNMFFINSNNTEIKYIYKISGRYRLNDKFNTQILEDYSIAYKFPQGCITTTFYKLSFELAFKWLNFLEKNINLCYTLGFEEIFKFFIYQNTKESIKFISSIGIEGYVSVDGKFFTI